METKLESSSVNITDLPMKKIGNYIIKRSFDIMIPDERILFIQVIPNSQYFTELEQILACLQLNWDNQEYMITALKNSISMGYKLIKP